MASKKVPIRVEVERETDTDFSAWADREGRSKRRHAEILIRKLTGLLKTNPDALARLGLADSGVVARA